MFCCGKELAPKQHVRQLFCWGNDRATVARRSPECGLALKPTLGSAGVGFVHVMYVH